MISDEFSILEKIFAILDDGIVNGYDSFKYVVFVEDGFTEEELHVTLGGVESDNVETNIDGSELLFLLRELKKISVARGDDWKGFEMSYEDGGQVKTSFRN